MSKSVSRSKKYNWKGGDKVIIKRKAKDSDYRCSHYSNNYSYFLDHVYLVRATESYGTCIHLNNGAMIPRHLLVRVTQ